MERLQITSLSTQDITLPLLAATYTADVDRELLIQLYLSGLAGNGNYRACTTKQLGGSGSAYQSPTSAVAVSTAVTTVYLPSLSVPVRANDVVKVYVQGLAADTSVNVTTEIFEISAEAAMQGEGANLVTLTITNASLPVEGARVWLTTDITGTTQKGSVKTSDSFGHVSFMLDAGTYYVWCKKDGIDFTNPETITVVAP